MRFTFRRRRGPTLGDAKFEGVPADTEPYYPEWYPTAMETKIIALAAAQGVANIELPVIYDDGERRVAFCGDCGRMICHPSCPKVIRARACALNPDEKA